MSGKYLSIIAGRLKEVAAIVSSGGSADSGKIPALDNSGRLDQSVMPVGIGANTHTFTASETLSAGAVVNVYDDSGTAKVRNADPSTEGKEAIGFVLTAASKGSDVAVYLDGVNTGLSALTPGGRYYLDALTPGSVTTTAPSGTGSVVQYVGRALTATELAFEPAVPVTLS